MVELSRVAVRAPRKTSARPSRNRMRSLRNPTLRSMRYAQTGAAVLPIRLPITTGRNEVRDMMTKRAPRAMPGQARRPRSSRQATATPVGGQMGVKTAPSTTSSRMSPSRPAT